MPCFSFIAMFVLHMGRLTLERVSVRICLPHAASVFCDPKRISDFLADRSASANTHSLKILKEKLERDIERAR